MISRQHIFLAAGPVFVLGFLAYFANAQAAEDPAVAVSIDVSHADLGIAPHIVEAALNHVSGARAGVAGTYNRATYLPEKKAALERWAAHVNGLVSGRAANIVTLPRKGA